MTPRVEKVVVRDSPMEVFLFAPKGAGPHPGLSCASTSRSGTPAWRTTSSP